MIDLPVGWDIAAVAELITAEGLFSDGDWVESKDQDPTGAIRLLQLADIGDGIFVNKSNRSINGEQFERLRCTEVFEGDILIARMPDPLGRACLAPMLGRRCITVVDVAIVRPGQSSVRPNWLMHFLNAPPSRQEIDLQASGTTRRRISRANLARLRLPIPPLGEQERIAGKLDVLLARVNACRERLNRVPSILKRFRQSVLAAASSGLLTADWREANPAETVFSKQSPENAAEVPEGWFWRQLSEIAQIRGGITKGRKLGGKNTELLPYLRVANVQDGFLDLNEIKLIEALPEDREKYRLEVGDILFTEGGDRDKLGRGTVWHGEIEDCIHQNHIFRARLFTKQAIPEYISLASKSESSRNYFFQNASQTVNLASINLTTLSALPIPLPPLAEQQEIIRRVQSLFAHADRLEKQYNGAREQVKHLAPSILNKAYHGELVPQNPNDEPASALLKRIRTAWGVDDVKLKQKRVRKASMKTLTRDAIKEVIQQLPIGGFSFDDICERIPADYETLKDIVFTLLSDPSSGLKQVFDDKKSTMRFVRVQP